MPDPGEREDNIERIAQFVADRSPALRPPQRRAVDRFLAFLARFDEPIGMVPRERVAAEIDEFTRSVTARDVPRLELSMATGTGKTRVMGTLASVLLASQEVDAVIFLGATRAVVRRLRRDLELQAADPLIVPEVRAQLIDATEAVISRTPSESTLPIVAALTVQALQSAIAGGDALPPALAGRRPVVFFDEAHHLRDGGSVLRWSFLTPVAALNPALVIGVTATPRAGIPLLYEYGLGECLRDGAYTKVPVVWVDSSSSGDSDAEVRRRLELGLQRLAEKRRKLQEFEQQRGELATGTPVMLVCALSVAEAKQIVSLLTTSLGLLPSEVIRVDTTTDAGLERALQVGEQRDRVRVVVQVRMLEEGWDVPNIYVILVERAGASWTNARQVVGRGLRLPFGARVGAVPGYRELDELDVLALGGSTFERLRDDITEDLGLVATPGGGDGIGLRKVTGDTQPVGVEAVAVASRPAALESILPVMGPIWPAPNWTALDLTPGDDEIVALSRPLFGAELAGERIRRRRMPRRALSTDEFIGTVAREFVEEVHFVDAQEARNLALEVARQVAHSPHFPVTAVPARLVDAMRTRAVRKFGMQPPSYRRTGDWTLPPEARFGSTRPTRQATEPWAGRTPAYGGWARGLYDFASFDVEGEFDAATLLDERPDVNWWYRNDPKAFFVWWAGGRYFPDFIVELKDRRLRLLLELKREDIVAEETGSDAMKKAAAQAWCECATASGDWEYRYQMIATEPGAPGVTSWLDGLTS